MDYLQSSPRFCPHPPWVSFKCKSTASDSRLSWNDEINWDSGRKIYCSDKYADILGYSGDVVFCSQIISQIMTYIDSCDLFENENNPENRCELILKLMKRSFGEYPSKLTLGNFEIIYATREKRYSFFAFSITWKKSKGWTSNKINMPSRTGLVITSGTGGESYRQRYRDYFERSDIGGFSRSFYSCLCEHIKSEADLLTGGVPQISGLFNRDPAKRHGTLIEGKRYIYGMEVDDSENINGVRWVNECFENCDGKALTRFPDAQLQPLPKKMGKSLGKDTQRMPLPR